MKKSVKLILVAIFAVGIFGMTGCVDHQERYETPPWLGGSSIEILTERGNYTTFLALMEKANYTEPISKQLFSLFVPNDEAFDAYFKSIGKNSVNDLTKDEAVSLFTLHVLRNPRSRFNLVYEFAWNEFQGPYQDIKMGEYASLFHRKETPSTSIPYPEVVKYSPPERIGQELLIYTGTKNVPLFTEEWFTDYGGDINGSDYVFMYPGSTWKKDYTPNLKGMNWHNAQVIPNPEIPDELEVRTASGFIYFLDRVVPIMPNIEEYMRNNQNKFGIYYDILQRFALYGTPKIDEQKRTLYQKSYKEVFDLAHERGPSAGNAGVIPPQNMWTAFLPTNDVMQNYLNNTVFKYYTTLDSVPSVTLFYILQTQLSRSVVLMSKLKNGYFNAFGDATDISQSDITSGYMCSNGVVYESKKVLEPNVFTCVPGLLFVDKDYTTLLYVLQKTNNLSVLSNPDSHVTLFASTNKALEEYGIRYNATGDRIEFRSPADGKWNAMSTLDLNFFAQDQIYKGRLSDFSGDGAYVENLSGNYINYGNNKIAAGENKFSGKLAGVDEVVVNERNGFLIKVNKPIQSRFVMGQYLVSDPEVSEFTALLVRANLLDMRTRDAVTKEVIPNLKFLAGAKYWTGFIPTNQAMKKAREAGIIPEKYPTSTAGKDSINSFIMYHFVKDDVVFDDGVSQKGIYKTNRTYKDTDGKTTLNATVAISNVPKNLSLTDVSEQVVKLDHAKANILVRKGVCHKIDTVLKYYK